MRSVLRPEMISYLESEELLELKEQQIFILIYSYLFWFYFQVRGILNKLTPEKFQKLSDDLLKTELDSGVILRGVILLIFEKALDEPKYSSMYAQLCKRLSEEAPNFEPPDSPCTFKVLLLSKCKAEFENRTATNDYFERYGGKLSPEDEEKKHLAKRKMLGNIKFIGELGKLDILAEGILHRCILQLLHPFKKRRAPAPSSSAITPTNASAQSGAQDSEDLECLAQLVRTCGRILDSDKGHNLMDQYFERMETLAQMPELPPRIRFMLRDVIELRRDNWVPRKATSTEGPMPIQQLRGDEDIRGGYMSRGREQRSTERESDWMMGGLRGINDMLSGLNVSSPSTNLIPTHHDKYNFSPNGFGNNRDHRSANEGAFRGHNNQRGNQGGNNYNNYNNRGYNKHNQHNNNTHNNSNYNSNNSSNKDLAPRFKKNLSMLVQGPEEVQMRPPANSLLFKANNIKANPPMPFNPVPRAHTGNDAPITMIVPTSVKVPPLAPASVLHKEAPVLIKQASVDKPKQIKKDKGPNKEELMKKVSFILSVEGENTTDTALVDVVVNAYKELKVPDKFAKDVVLTVFNDTLEKNDPARELTIKLLLLLRKESLLPIQAPLDGLRALCASMSARETATPRIASLVGGLIAHAVIGGLVTLVDVASLTENGQHYPLFLLVLQQMLKNMGKQELVDIYNASKVNLMAVLPECDRTKDRLAEILEDRALSFLCPLLRVQAELWKQLQADTNPQKFYKWIKDNLDVSCHTDPGFINALMTVLLKYITQETTLSDGSIPSVLPSKPLLDKEKALLERFRVVFKAFLNGRTDLQLTALYSLQVYCFSLNFPKGMLLRWFMSLYEFEIIEEDVFLNWKEDLTDAYPGKGKGLFQVNNWLTWLQETPSTDEEGDD